jgi:hypothetical protein
VQAVTDGVIRASLIRASLARSLVAIESRHRSLSRWHAGCTAPMASGRKPMPLPANCRSVALTAAWVSVICCCGSGPTCVPAGLCRVAGSVHRATLVPLIASASSI